MTNTTTHTKPLTPKLRFKEYEGEWEEKRLESQISSIDSGWSPQCEEYPSEKDEWGVLKTTSVVWEGFNPDANKKLPSKFEPRPELQVLANDILITRAGPTSRVGVSVHVDEVREKLMISDKLIRIKVLENCSSHFFAVLLGNRNAQKQLISKSSGLAESQTNISQKILLKTKLLLPSIKEQQKIANFLTAVDTKLQQLTTKKETLAQYKKGVMQQLFSQQLRFKPDVIANAVKQSHEAISPNETQFPDWEEKRLGEIFNNIGGTALEKFFSLTGSHKVVSIGNYSTDGKYNENGQKVILNDKTRTKLLEKGDLVMVLNDKTSTGDIIGSTILIPKNDLYIYNQRSERLICIPIIIDPLYAWFQLNHKEFRKTIFSVSQGGTQIYVNFSEVKKLKLNVPSIPEQQKIANYLSAIDKKIEAVQTQLTQTQAFKKGLLQQMFV